MHHLYNRDTCRDRDCDEIVRQTCRSYGKLAVVDQVDALLKMSGYRRAFPSVEQRRSIRLRACLTQAEIAQGLGVAPTTVCRWERGERSPRGRAGDAYVALLHCLGAEDLP